MPSVIYIDPNKNPDTKVGVFAATQALLLLLVLLTRNRFEVDLYTTVLGSAIDVSIAGNR